MENVAALVSQKFLPLFNKWLLTLESLGYTNHWQVLNAKDYGIPQNRQRVFVVSILGDHVPYYFPEPFKLTKTLEDMLEDEDKVDERYYVNDDKVSEMLKRCDNDRLRQLGLDVNDVER